jgi:hypothetical protein
MPLVDPTGREWRHHLRVERSGEEVTPAEVAEYFLSYLTLDDVDENGRTPPVPFAAYADRNFVDVYWDRDFTFAEVETMAKITLPDQLVGLQAEDQTDAIGPVWYDGVEVQWLPQEDEEEQA